tara:strand:- start:384 stop:1298 length:915 start_codon:yes stop_codon:yes gene_type:complete
MAVEIVSGDSTDQLSIDPISKAARVTMYASDGHEGFHSHPVLVASNSATALGEFVLPSLNAEDYRFISFQLTGTWEGTVIFEGCNDNTTFYSIATTDPSGNGTGQETATVNRIVKVPVLTKYIRARVSAYTSGTISAVIYGYVDENSSGLISTLGTMTLSAETTKKIGNVGLEAGVNQIGSVVIDPSPISMETDLYVGQTGAVDVNSRNIKNAPTTLRSFVFTNLAATPRYLKLYDTAGTPVAGVGSPVLIISLPAVGTLAFPLPSEGFVFANGIGMTMVLGPEDGNTTGTATVDFSTVGVFYA